MKKLKSIALALVVIFSTASATAQTKNINIATSSVEWVGKKLAGQHNGTVNFKDGVLVLKGGKLKGGKFTLDMTSITATDISGEHLEKLNGHLKSEDFFGTEKFPTATLVFTKIKNKSANIYTVTADLTIKGITKPVVFDITVDQNSATTAFNVDRTKYGIKFNSKSFFDSLGDRVIADEFELAVTLKF